MIYLINIMENEELIVHQPTMVVNEHTENVSSNMNEINKYFKNYYHK